MRSGKVGNVPAIPAWAYALACLLAIPLAAAILPKFVGDAVGQGGVRALLEVAVGQEARERVQLGDDEPAAGAQRAAHEA